MFKEVMKKWVKALRSGKFKQGQGTLKQFNSRGVAQHCCLGVLCELYNDSMRKSKKKTLPEKVYDNDCDFSHGYSRFGGEYDHEESLADLNDSGRKFKTIAGIIEKYWEVL